MLAAQACHAPSGASSKQVKHYALMIKHNYFGGMIPDEYGKYINYQISYIRVPILLIHSESDSFIKKADVDRTDNFLKMSNPNIERVNIAKKYKVSHGDYLMGMLAPELIFDKIIDLFARYSK